MILLTSSLVECLGYILPDTDYQEQQLLLLTQLLEDAAAGHTNIEDILEDYSDYAGPADVLEVKPTDEEIVEALLDQLDNPAQSEALYEELVRSKGRLDENNLENSPNNIKSMKDSESLINQLHTLATSRLANPESSFHKTPKTLSSRRKRSIPPFVRQGAGGYKNNKL